MMIVTWRYRLNGYDGASRPLNRVRYSRLGLANYFTIYLQNWLQGWPPQAAPKRRGQGGNPGLKFLPNSSWQAPKRRSSCRLIKPGF